MSSQPPPELVAHVVRTTDLTRAEAARVVSDVIGYFAETPQVWVRRRHRDLQRRGLSNDAIFARISAELPHQLFRAGELTVRQLRRLVYG